MNAQQAPLAGVIGDPIEHSLSPRLFGHWLNSMNIEGRYLPMRVSSSDLKSVLDTLPKAGFVGINVTIPHKEKVLDFADKVTDRAALIGAANTLTLSADGKIFADNTDGYGFLENIYQSVPTFDPSKGPVVVFGAGGAARAVVTSLLDKGATEIRLLNRTRTRAENLRSDFGIRVKVHDWFQAPNIIEDATTIVNTTSLGMKGKPEFKVPLDNLSAGTVVTDLVYNPLKTKFLQEAEAKGCTIVDGLGMLLHQAVPGFERWFGQRPVVDEALRHAILNK